MEALLAVAPEMQAATVVSLGRIVSAHALGGGAAIRALQSGVPHHEGSGGHRRSSRLLVLGLALALGTIG